MKFDWSLAWKILIYVEDFYIDLMFTSTVKIFEPLYHVYTLKKRYLDGERSQTLFLEMCYSIYIPVK